MWSCQKIDVCDSVRLLYLLTYLNDLQDMLGRDFTPEEIDQMIKDSGASGDPPVLSFSQFKHMMLKKDGAHLHKMTVVGKLPDHAAGSAEPRSAA